MDKLKLAFKLVAQKAKSDREEGSVPSFLGPQGMLALMFNSIKQFSKNEDEPTKYLLQLAVDAVFALSTVLPDMELDDGPEESEDTEISDGIQEEREEADSTDESSMDDSRWTSVPAGQPIPTVERKNKEDD